MNPAKRERLHETRRICLGVDDILIARGEMSPEETANLVSAVRRLNPHWRGFLINLRIDQDIETMPEPMARDVYDRLRDYFEERNAAKASEDRKTD